MNLSVLVSLTKLINFKYFISIITNFLFSISKIMRASTHTYKVICRETSWTYFKFMPIDKMPLL